MPKRLHLIPVDDELLPLSDDLKKQIISALPDEMKPKANQLMEALQKAGVYVSKDAQKINYIGKSATGSPILDLVKWALASEKVALPPDYKLFKKMIKEIDLPGDFLPVKQKPKQKVVNTSSSTNRDNSDNQSKWVSLY